MNLKIEQCKLYNLKKRKNTTKNRQAEMAILLSHELDFKAKSIIRHKERHFIMIKEAIYLKNI